MKTKYFILILDAEDQYRKAIFFGDGANIFF